MFLFVTFNYNDANFFIIYLTSTQYRTDTPIILMKVRNSYQFSVKYKIYWKTMKWKFDFQSKYIWAYNVEPLNDYDTVLVKNLINNSGNLCRFQ